jgi:hypothetical protein
VDWETLAAIATVFALIAAIFFGWFAIRKRVLEAVGASIFVTCILLGAGFITIKLRPDLLGAEKPTPGPTVTPVIPTQTPTSTPIREPTAQPTVITTPVPATAIPVPTPTRTSTPPSTAVLTAPSGPVRTPEELANLFFVKPYYDPDGQETCHRRDNGQAYPCSPPGGQPPPTSSYVCTDPKTQKEYPCDPSEVARSPSAPPPRRSDLFLMQPYSDPEGPYTCYNRKTRQPYTCNVPGDTPPPYRSDLFRVQPYSDPEGQKTCYRPDTGQPYSCTILGDTPPPNTSYVCDLVTRNPYPCDPYSTSSYVCTDPVTRKPYPCDPFALYNAQPTLAE